MRSPRLQLPDRVTPLLPAIEAELAEKLRRSSRQTRAARPGKNAPDSEAVQPTVLLFGKMRELALYRAEVLQRMGYQVIVPKSYAEAVRAVDDGGFHVAILSYTLSSEVVKELADLIRQRYPGCPLVTIAQHARSDAEIQPDAIVLSELGPTGLVEALDRLRKKRLQ